MNIKKSNNSSIFNIKSIDEVYKEIQNVYLKYPLPWVIGYSGGKDSTCILQLIWNALERLKPQELSKPVYVIASDTLVETPVIVNFINNTLKLINEKAQESNLPFTAEKVLPSLNDSFWVNLIGRGYPAPTTRFRWCTERLKIKPANRYIQEKVAHYGEVIMALGTRKTESTTRMQLMNTNQITKNHVLRRHSMLSGTYVYAPIADFTTDDVWTYLLQVPSPWGGDNRQLATLYRSANSGECPLVIDTSTPSCGNSRFGCWVCTVARKDSSMESIIDSGEEWLEPLLEFRDWLLETTKPEKKLEYRDIKGRDGRVLFKKDGTFAARTYKLDVNKDMLKEVLIIQDKLRQKGPDPNISIISEKELREIRHIWRTERQDWEDSVPKIYEEIFGDSLEWPIDDDKNFNGNDKERLKIICKEKNVPFELVAKLIEIERVSLVNSNFSDIKKRIISVFKEEWRTKEEIIAERGLELEG